MGNLIVSIGIKHDIFAITIHDGGSIKYKHTERIKDTEISSSSYKSIIYVFIIALRLVRQYIESNKDCSRNVCFEVSNSIFIKWVANNYSKDAYQEQFVKAMNLLQELPIKYAFSYSYRPKAIPFATKEYLKKETLSSLE